MKAWERFVLDHGFRARLADLAAVLCRSVEEIDLLRHQRACTRRKKGKEFHELFALWHGRTPKDSEYPPPRRSKAGSYVWQAPELALLASLVGQLDKKAICKVLTERLKEVTGDRRARRNLNAVQVAINRVGLTTSDIVGGVTAAQAGREIGSYAIIIHAIDNKRLDAKRHGRYWVIARKDLEVFKKSYAPPPPGYIRVRPLFRQLGITSDKGSELSRIGYVPSAIRCTPLGGSQGTTQFGVWYIDSKVAKQLLADRRAGRPMPWHGAVLPDNLRKTFALWQERKHPARCEICQRIWGRLGVPKTMDDFGRGYAKLEHGQKRHLTRPWSDGLSVGQVVAQSCRSEMHVRRAIASGVLPAKKCAGGLRVTQTDATRWISRKCPTGDSERSWMTIQAASKQHQFAASRLEEFIRKKKLRARTVKNQGGEKVRMVLRHQVALLREKIGFTEAETARRLRITITKVRSLLKGASWRRGEAIPLDTVNTLRKRIESKQGWTYDEAAKALRVDVAWVRERVREGVVSPLRAKWDKRRLYFTDALFERLKAYKRNPPAKKSGKGLLLSEAAQEAGMCTTTLIRLSKELNIRPRPSARGLRYARHEVRACARRFWKKQRLHRAVPPAWLQAEMART